jgi:hypothetical protein
MDITKQEAHESLAQIEDAIAHARRAIGQGTTSSILIVWGLVWLAGYLSTQFEPKMAPTVWLCLVIAGSLASWICGSRSRSRLNSLDGRRVGLFWLVLFTYAAFWFVLLHSEPGQRGFGFTRLTIHDADTITQQSGAFFATVPMFAYVVGGLWFGRFFIVLGAMVTVLTIIGYCFVPGWFNLWMAVIGGGSLVLSGLYIRRYWR